MIQRLRTLYNEKVIQQLMTELEYTIFIKFQKLKKFK